MKELKLKFENCYGIKKLEETLEFYTTLKNSPKKTTHAMAIYAPNGSMKTSFARAFRDLANNKESKDLVFSERTTIREIKDEQDNDIISEQVFVIEPYVEDFDSNKKSTLLANSELKSQYEQAHDKINLAKAELFKKLKPLTGLSGRNNNIEIEIEKVFNKNFFEVLLELEEEISTSNNIEYSNIIYNEIFNNDVLNLLSTRDFKEQISKYIEKYDEIIEQSEYLKKDFNHYNALTVHKNLKDNGFFKAFHSLNMNNGIAKLEVLSEEELNKIITKEKQRVLESPDIEREFNEIDKKLSKESLRKFRDYISDNQEVILKLENYERFRIVLWKAYLVNQKDLYISLLKTYKLRKKEIDQIVESAKAERTKWEQAIGKFNERFTTPFSLVIKNKVDVILNDDVAYIEFHFKDLNEECIITKDALLNVLSQGEKRALYLLNIIFEVEARNAQNLETFFIIDDIADSFDYKNKYAIIEYLKEMSQNSSFYLIILTHNFDFFRTVGSRFVGRDKCYMVSKSDAKIKLFKAEYIKNPFSYIKNNINKKECFITAIPFVRNLVEYCKNQKCPEYLKLTSLLHYKEDSSSILVEHLEDIFNTVLPSLPSPISISDKKQPVIELIDELAENISCLKHEGINLENKIILSISLRHKAEKFMVREINNPAFIQNLENGKNQTMKLISKYKQDFPLEIEKIRILERVNLITPENIHFNTFMFEPILDMSDVHLKSLYSDVKKLES